jgi:hypothetical protein
MNNISPNLDKQILSNAVGVEVITISIVQRRKHKKKRINKKWLKRYGNRVETKRGNEVINRDTKVMVRGTSCHSCIPNYFNLDFVGDFNESNNL